MSTIKEQIIPMRKTFNDSKTRRAIHLAGSLAENLQDGDYVLSTSPKPVFFIRVNEWTKKLTIEIVDTSENYEIMLSNGKIIDLHRPQIDQALEGINEFRIVLLSNQGFSSFKVSK